MIYNLSHLTSVCTHKSTAEFTNSGLSLVLSEIDDDDDDDLSEGELSNSKTFPDDEQEEGGEDDSDDEDNESVIMSNNEGHIITQIAAIWVKQKATFNSNYAITG